MKRVLFLSSFLSFFLSLNTFSLTAQDVPVQPNTEQQEIQSPRGKAAATATRPNPRGRALGRAEGRQPDPAQRAARMAQALELDEKQTAELSSFMTSSATAMRDEMAAAKTPEERAAIREEYRQVGDKKITGMLRPDQLERYEAMKARRAEAQEERIERMQQRKQDGEGTPNEEIHKGKPGQGKGKKQQ